MSSLVEQFKDALTSTESLRAFLLTLKEGIISPLAWDLNELKELSNDYFKIFDIKNHNFVEERIKFNEYFAGLLQRLGSDCIDPTRKSLLERASLQCISYIRLIRADQKNNKRPLTNPKLPTPKKRRMNSTAQPNENPQFKYLTQLGYTPTLSQMVLSSVQAPQYYRTLIRWHELFINLFSHDQLIRITLEGGEQSFIALSNYLLPLVNYRYNTQDIFELIKGPRASERMAGLFHHMDDLIFRGFNNLQIIVIGKSVYSIQNLPQINEELYQFHLDEVTDLVSESPPEIFLLINQHLDSFISLSLTARHLITLIRTGDYSKIYWILANFQGLSAFKPEILCTYKVSQLEQEVEKINRLLLMGYSQEQIKQISRSCWGSAFLTAVAEASPDLLAKNYSAIEILDLLTNILTTISEKEASSLNDAVKFLPLLLKHGFQPPDLIDFFCENVNHGTIINVFLPFLPQLFEYGFTSSRIIKLALKVNIKSYLHYFTRLIDLNYSGVQLLQMEKHTKYKIMMTTIIETTPALITLGYSTDDILTIAKTSRSALATAVKFTPALLREGFSLADLIVFLAKQMKHSIVIETLIKSSPILIEYGLTCSQIIKMAPYCKSEGLLLLAEHFPKIYDQFQVKNPGSSREKLLKLIVRQVSMYNGLAFLQNFLASKNIKSGPSNRLLPNLIKKTKYYCPQLKSFIFLYPAEVRDMHHIATEVNSTLRTLDFSGKVKALKEHFALLMDENLWSRLWSDLPPPTETATPEDLNDKTRDPNNYYCVENQDTAVYLYCRTPISAGLCANRLRYLNQQVQKANKGIEETIQQFTAVAVDNCVLIDNYGAYFDSLSTEYPERYEKLPQNVDDFRLLSVDEAQRLGLFTHAANTTEPLTRVVNNTNQLPQQADFPRDENRNDHSRGFGFFSAPDDAPVEKLADEVLMDKNNYL